MELQPVKLNRRAAVTALTMGERFLTDGMLPESGDVDRLEGLLGRPLRTYRAFVSEISAA